MSNTLYYIYKHTSYTTSKSYIGITDNLTRRWTAHKSSARNNSELHFHRAIRKYGEGNWNTIVLCITNDVDDAYWLEHHLIKEYNTVLCGYNMSEGGKRSPTLRGKHHPMYGKSHSLEARQKISQNHKDMSGSNNTNAKHIWLRSPDGQLFKTHGKLKAFCQENNLGYSTVVRQLKIGVKPKRINNYKTSFVGWEVWFPTQQELDLKVNQLIRNGERH